MPKKKPQKRKELNTDRATKWIGSVQSLIVHTIVFVTAFVIPIFGIAIDRVLLVLTTLLSLEAIYLAIFIQMSVNKNTEDIEEIQEDVEDIQEEIEDIGEDVEEIQKDIDEIQEDVEEIEEEHEKDYEEDRKLEKKEAKTLEAIQATLAELHKEIESLKKK
jgi:peptidoglycan hydrolase CwlO-like protein